MSSFEGEEWESYLSSFVFSTSPPSLSDITYNQENSNYHNPDNHHQHQSQHYSSNGNVSLLLHTLHSSVYPDAVAQEPEILSHHSAVTICNQGQDLISNTSYPFQKNSQNVTTDQIIHTSASLGPFRVVQEEKLKVNPDCRAASERAIKIARYRAKRLARCFQKVVKYPKRQEAAKRRNRIRGRFAPGEENVDKLK